MTKEYAIKDRPAVRTTEVKLLNDMAELGWELAATERLTFLFSRDRLGQNPSQKEIEE